MAGTAVRIENSSRAHAEALGVQLTGYRTELVSHNGTWQLEVDLGELGPPLVQLFQTLGEWLEDSKVDSLLLHFDERRFTLLRSGEGSRWRLVRVPPRAGRPARDRPRVADRDRAGEGNRGAGGGRGRCGRVRPDPRSRPLAAGRAPLGRRGDRRQARRVRVAAAAPLEVEQSRRESAQGVEIELAGRERLDADVIRAGVEVRLDAVADRLLVAPDRRARRGGGRCRRPRGRTRRIRAGACCSGSSASPCSRSTCSRMSSSARAASSVRITACSGASSLSAPRRSRAWAVCSGGTRYGCAPSVRSRARSSIFGPSAASTTGAGSAGSGPMYGADSIASR